MTLYASDFDQSNYLKAADLGESGAEKRLKIKNVTRETVGEQQDVKACVWFTNTEKGLLLNKTNLRTLQGGFGNAMDGWPGKVVVVFSTMVDFRGKISPALRVRIPPPKQVEAAAPTGNGTAATQAPAAAASAAVPPVKKPICDELDDEISW